MVSNSLSILIPAYYFPGFTVTHIARALEKEGHRVFSFAPEGEGKNFFACPKSVSINQLIKDYHFNPDLVLAVESGYENKVFFPLGLETLKVPKVWLAIDSHLNFRWHKEFAYLFDLVFVAQSELIPWYQKYGLKNVHWLPLACDPEVHRDYNLKRDIDLAFVGNFTQKRRELFDYLRTQLSGLNFAFKEKVYGEDLAKIYSRAKIVINPLARKDLNMRTFEAMSCGALLLNEDNRSLNKLFEIGKDLDVYPGNIRSILVEKIKYYLSHDSLRERVARSGQKKVLSEHTYSLRVRKILEIIGNEKIYAFPEARILLANSLLYYDKQFRSYRMAKDYFIRAIRKNLVLTVKNLIGYFFYNRVEKLRKLFKTWPY